MINCKICNREFEQITSTHLKRHDISVKEYKLLFPDAPIFTEEGRVKLSNNCKSLQNHESFGFKNGHQINKDKEPYNKGRTKFDDERILKYAEKLKGRIIDYETRRKISDAVKKGYLNGAKQIMKGPLNGMFGKKLTESHIKALHGGWRNKKTRPEKMMERMCTQYGFKYVGDRSYKIKFSDGRLKYPDFVMPSMKIAIEVFGDYWHRGEDPKELIEKYAKIGWKCLVVWESELHSEKIHPETIEDFLGIFEIEPFTIEDFSGNWIN